MTKVTIGLGNPWGGLGLRVRLARLPMEQPPGPGCYFLGI